MCRATKQECMDFWARILTEQGGYEDELIAIIAGQRYIISNDNDDRVAIINEPSFKQAGDKFCELSGWDVPC